MTGVDWPGKSASQSLSFMVILAGRFFSSELPFCCGPRQLSQPRTVVAAGEGRVMAPLSSKPSAMRAVRLFMAFWTPKGVARPCRRAHHVTKILHADADCK